jgi:hypothetical protein
MPMRIGFEIQKMPRIMNSTFNHHLASQLIRANCAAIEKVILGQFERLASYKAKPNASQEYIDKMEQEITVMFNSLQEITKHLEEIVNEFSQAQARAFARGQEQGIKTTERMHRYGGLDPRNYLPKHREAIRSYNIAQQRLRDNID